MLERLEHLGIAVRELESAEKLFRDIFGLRGGGREEVESEGVRVSFFPLGDTRLELLEPTRPDSPIARFLEKRGEGIHHLCFEVRDLQKALDKLQSAGVRLIDSTPREGAEGTKVAFLHPKAASGVLIELVEKSKDV